MQAALVRQQKDPKKQEAGRKGAEARQKKMEALKAELVAAKEAVSETVPKEHAEQHVKPVVEQRVSECSEGTPGWIMGISLAVIMLSCNCCHQSWYCEAFQEALDLTEQLGFDRRKTIRQAAWTYQ